MSIQDIATTSLCGVLRGIFVHTLIQPLDVIKIHQQCQATREKNYQVAYRLFQQEGVGVFYRGLTLQLARTSFKQIWCWPVITKLPAFLEQRGVGAFPQQALTGLATATIDAFVSTPLERAKILSIIAARREFSWKGFAAHWAKLSVYWSTFLVAQKYFRGRAQQGQEQGLSLSQLTSIGVCVAFVVSLAAAPLDIANTLKQSQNVNLKQFLTGSSMSRMYRGWPLSFFALVIHNVASVILIDKLDT